jgi:predicted molibdopterin-dependent oxidoreductase YjgC
MDTITLTIDGLPIEAQERMTVLEAATAADIYIPTLCYDPDLEPHGACRLCVVGIGSGERLFPACRTPVEEGMIVTTSNPRIDLVRRIAVELLITNHEGDCLICAKSQDCQLKQVAAYVGIDADRLERLRQEPRSLPIDDSNPFFHRDMNKCILCLRCIRTCREVVGCDAIALLNRGYTATVGTFGDKPLAESRCESCGECLVRCPVGALVPVDTRQPSREVKTICPYCGVGCGIYLGLRGSAVVNVLGDRDNPASAGQLCVKGRFGHSFVNHPDRLHVPLVEADALAQFRRSQGSAEAPTQIEGFVEVEWDEALDLVATRWQEILDREGADAIGVLSSARCTNEENYLVQKLARAVLGTNNVDHCARL